MVAREDWIVNRQQDVDARFAQAVEEAKQEILNGLPLIEYLKRTNCENEISEWASLLAEFGGE